MTRKTKFEDAYFGEMNMRTISVEVDKTDNGFQVVERTRENGKVVNEVRYQEVRERATAERMAAGGEFSFSKFRHKSHN